MNMRYIAVTFLLLSGIAAFTIDMFGQDLCIYEYISMGSITYFKELNGVSSNDPSMLGMCGLLSITFSIILIFIRNKYAYSSIVLILLFLELILLNMIETASYKEIIYDSIMKCSNFSLLVWIVFHLSFLVTSIFYIIKHQDLK